MRGHPSELGRMIRRETLARYAGAPVARGLARTCRFRTVGPGGEISPHARPLGNEIYVLWHSTLLMLGLAHRDEHGVILISRHRDGEILARTMEKLGYGTARGSSTRGGAAGLREMVAAGHAGRPLGLTPDGPTGPVRVCKPGPVHLGMETGLPVVPCAAAATRCRRINSWDRFVVPLPGATVYCSYGEPMHIGGGGRSADAMTDWQNEIGRRIDLELQRCEEAVIRKT